MLIKVGFEIAFESPQPAPMLLMMYLHASREQTTIEADRLVVTPSLPISEYFDSYGNRCGRVLAPAGKIAFRNEALVSDSGLPDQQVPNAPQLQIQDLPSDVLIYLLASRYCEVDRIGFLVCR